MQLNSGKNLRILFLAYWFPPVHAIASQRTFNIAKHLSRRGWHITVVTPSPDSWRMVDDDGRIESLEAHGGVKRIVTGHRWRFLFPQYLKSWNRGLGYFVGGVGRKLALYLDIERQAGWAGEAEKVCATFRQGEFDLILATGGPFVSFKLARDLSERLKCPFVLDYRDLWTGNSHLHKPLRRNTVLREKAILDACAAATVVSPSLKEYLSHRFNDSDKLFVLYNGYDAEELAAVRSMDFGHFAIVYAGIFYIPTSTVTPIMAALKSLKNSPTQETADWRFHYYGPQGEYVSEEARRYGVLDRVSIHGMVPRQSVLSAIRSANVAVVITSVKTEATLEEKGIVTGKIYEPLGLGTPILLIAPPGSDAAELVAETGVGHQFHGGEAEGMATFLRQLMANYKVRAKIPDQYSWQYTAGKMETVLFNVLAREKTVQRTSS